MLRSHRAPRLRLVITSLLVLVTSCLAPTFRCGDAEAQSPQKSGRWTSASNWGWNAIHLTLMPGDSVYHSKVLWWGRPNGAFTGGLFGWNPSTDDQCASWPSSSFQSLSLAAPPYDIFCAGQTEPSGIAGVPGHLLVIGGTQSGTGTINGVRDVVLFNANSSPQWVTQASMSEPRWYGTAIGAPREGTTFALSGSRSFHEHSFGGRAAGASQPSNSLRRLTIASTATWNSTITGPTTGQSTEWPEPREGHTAVVSSSVALLPSADAFELVFGGKNATGHFNSVYRMTRPISPTREDFGYEAKLLGVSSTESPSGRAYHTSVMATNNLMIVVGGQEFGGTASGDVWTAEVDAVQGQVSWQRRTTSITGTGPGPRFGHIAHYDAPRNRVLIFGGRGTAGALASMTVYSLALNSSGVPTSWSTPTVSGTVPSSRSHVAAAFDPTTETHAGGASTKLVLFGGDVGTSEGSAYAGDLWVLWIAADGSLSWESKSPTGAAKPAPRAKAAAMVDWYERRFYLDGGLYPGTSTSDTAWSLVATEAVGGYAWRIETTNSTRYSGHTAVFYDSWPTFARVPEQFTTNGTPAWSTLSSAIRYHDWYPFAFFSPGLGPNKVFVAGPHDTSFTLDLSTQQWQAFPNANTGFRGGSAVMYRPGKIMKCGSRQTDAGGPATGATKWTDLTSASPAWTSTAATPAEQMLGRVYFNSTLLPTGEVLTTGGMDALAANAQPVKRPQIWAPPDDDLGLGGGSAGSWRGASGPDTLSRDPFQRDYHSTAVLMPDGRVLSAGGEIDFDQRKYANQYCPPYLFDRVDNPGSPAARPTITCAPEVIVYGQTFHIEGLPAVPEEVLRGVCLVRASTTTHGFNPDQRFVPLEFTCNACGAGPPGSHGIDAIAPADSLVAPPGDYLLFLVGWNNSTPSLGRWVRLKRADDVPPDPVQQLQAEFVAPQAIVWSWYETGDDGRKGQPSSQQARYSLSAITDANFGNATLVASNPDPTCAGTYQSAEACNLSSCTKYYFGVRATDDAGLGTLRSLNWVKTLCSGTGGCGGGGGFSAVRVPGAGEAEAGEEAGSNSMSSPPASDGRRASAFGGLRRGGETVLVAEYSPGATTRWRITRIERAQVEGLDAEVTTGMLVQDVSPDGGWTTRQHLANPGDAIGVRALIRDGRVVFVDSADVDVIDTQPAGYACVGATHSTLGALSPVGGTTQIASAAQLASGESIVLDFDRTAAAPLEDALDCFFVVRRGSTPYSGATHSVRDTPPPPNVPARFALHPNTPNPFAMHTELRFDLPAPAFVRLEIFDLQGRRVARVAHGHYPAGFHSVGWDRSRAAAARIGPGVYACRLVAGNDRAERKLIVY